MAATWRWQALAGLLAVIGVFMPRTAHGQADIAQQVYQRTLKGTVMIIGNPMKGGGQGTGAILDAQRRLIVTNHHVVGDSDDAIAVFPLFQMGKLVAESDFYIKDLVNKGGKVEASRGKILAKDLKVDLAIIQVDSLPNWVMPLPLAAASPGPGAHIHSVGNPGSSDALWVYTSGTVRAVYHKKWQSGNARQTFDHEADVIETQSPTNPGDSGGPLVNDRSELVGVTQSFDSGARLASVFVDVAEVKTLLKSKNITVKAAPPIPVATTTPVEAPSVSAEDRAEQQAGTRLKAAQLLINGGKADKGKEYLQDIIDNHPKTKAAEEARQLLEKLKK